MFHCGLTSTGIIVKEESRLLVAYYVQDTQAVEQKHLIWRNYTTQFNQESVLLADVDISMCTNTSCSKLSDTALGTPTFRLHDSPFRGGSRLVLAFVLGIAGMCSLVVALWWRVRQEKRSQPYAVTTIFVSPAE